MTKGLNKVKRSQFCQVPSPEALSERYLGDRSFNSRIHIFFPPLRGGRVATEHPRHRKATPGPSTRACAARVSHYRRDFARIHGTCMTFYYQFVSRVNCNWPSYNRADSPVTGNRRAALPSRFVTEERSNGRRSAGKPVLLLRQSAPLSIDCPFPALVLAGPLTGVRVALGLRGRVFTRCIRTRDWKRL